MVKELQGTDYDRLGLSRGVFSAMSGDDEKMAHSLIEDAKKKKLDVSVKFNPPTGEYVVFKEGNMEGVINKKGLSRQDFANVVRDPTNVLFAIPGVGQVGAGARALSGVAKAVKYGKDALKLGGAVAGTDLANSSLANNEGGRGFGVDSSDVTRAGIMGATSPIADLMGQYALKKFRLPKKTQKKQNFLDVMEADAEKGILHKSPGQKGEQDLFLLEDRARRGGLGVEEQELVGTVDRIQDKAISNKLKDTFKIGRDQEISNEIKSDAGNKVLKAFRQADSLANQSVEEAYAVVQPIFEKTTIDNNIRDIIKSDLQAELFGRKGVFGLGAEDLTGEALQAYKSVEKGLSVAKNLEDLESLRRILVQSEQDIYGKVEPRRLEQRAITATRKALDSSIDALTNSKMLNLSNLELQQIKSARDIQRDYASKFLDYKDKDKAGFYKKARKEDITGSEIIDAIAKPKDNVSALTNLKNLKKVLSVQEIDEIKKGFMFENFRKAGTNELDVRQVSKRIIDIIDTEYAKELFSTAERKVLKDFARELEPIIQTAGRNKMPRPDLYDRLGEVVNSINHLPFLGVFGYVLAPIIHGFKVAGKQAKINKLRNAFKKSVPNPDLSKAYDRYKQGLLRRNIGAGVSGVINQGLNVGNK